MLDSGRERLAERTRIENGEVKKTDDGSAVCYDFRAAPDAQTLEQAYLRYVAYMIDEFSPHWLNIAVEVNLFFEKCPSAAGGLTDVANAAYDAAKAKRADLVVFPSIQIDHLYGYSTDSCPSGTPRSACFDALYAQIAPLKRDRFAMSTYPMLSVAGSPADLPADWFTRGASRAGERPLVAETGWNSAPLIVEPRGAACATLFASTEADEAAYLGRVLDAAQADDIDLVNWWSDRDFFVTQPHDQLPLHVRRDMVRRARHLPRTAQRWRRGHSAPGRARLEGLRRDGSARLLRSDQAERLPPLDGGAREALVALKPAALQSVLPAKTTPSGGQISTWHTPPTRTAWAHSTVMLLQTSQMSGTA